MEKNNKLIKTIITLSLVSLSALTVHAQFGLPGGGADPDSTISAVSRQTAGYSHAAYYYMPDVGIYYDIPAHQYIYASDKGWVRKRSLPAKYRQYDIYHGYKVVLNQPSPWLNDDELKARYARHRRRRRLEIQTR